MKVVTRRIKITEYQKISLIISKMKDETAVGATVDK